MYSYYFKVALYRIRHKWGLSLLIILAIAIGLGASMSMLTVLQVMDHDPLPQKSSDLYHPWLYTQSKNNPPGSAGDSLTYVDAKNLIRLKGDLSAAMMANGSALVIPTGRVANPAIAHGEYVSADFFSMFDVPLAFGRFWNHEDGQGMGRVIVLSKGFSQYLFGHPDSVGKMVYVDNKEFRVVGVSDSWGLYPKPYVGKNGKPFGGREKFFIPMQTAVGLNLPVNGRMQCWGSGSGVEKRTGSSCRWLQFWVLLHGTKEKKKYKLFLQNYAKTQMAPGRFDSQGRKVDLFSMKKWYEHIHLVPSNVSLQIWLAQAFFFICILNVIGLLLVKYLQCSSEIGIRRALGARKTDIFSQFLIESLPLGVLGGALGITFALAGVYLIQKESGSYSHLVHMSDQVLALSILAGILAPLLAALLPAWRVSRANPAATIKVG